MGELVLLYLIRLNYQDGLTMDEKDSLISSIKEFHKVVMEYSVEDFIHWMKENQISRYQIGIMMFLKRSDGSQISQLSQELGVSAAAASQMVDRLFQTGFLLREEIPKDRRSKLIKLTEKGENIVKDAHSSRIKWMKPLKDSFSAKEKEEIVKAMNLLTRGAKKLRTPLKDSVKI